MANETRCSSSTLFTTMARDSCTKSNRNPSKRNRQIHRYSRLPNSRFSTSIRSFDVSPPVSQLSPTVSTCAPSASTPLKPFSCDFTPRGILARSTLGGCRLPGVAERYGRWPRDQEAASVGCDLDRNYRWRDGRSGEMGYDYDEIPSTGTLTSRCSIAVVHCTHCSNSLFTAFVPQGTESTRFRLFDYDLPPSHPIYLFASLPISFSFTSVNSNRSKASSFDISLTSSRSTSRSKSRRVQESCRSRAARS